MNLPDYLRFFEADHRLHGNYLKNLHLVNQEFADIQVQRDEDGNIIFTSPEVLRHPKVTLERKIFKLAQSRAHGYMYVMKVIPYVNIGIIKVYLSLDWQNFLTIQEITPLPSEGARFKISELELWQNKFEKLGWSGMIRYAKQLRDLVSHMNHERMDFCLL